MIEIRTEPYTVKELADELGVTKQAVFNKLRLPELAELLESHLTLDGRTQLISVEGANRIKELFPFTTPMPVTNNNAATATVHVAAPPPDEGVLNFLRDTISLLQEQLERKDVQIAEKDEQLRQLQNRLAEAHQFSSQAQQMMATIQLQAIEASFNAQKPKGIFSKFRR